MKNETPLYPYDVHYAAEREELPRWRESNQANISCKEAIEDAISRNFDGLRLNDQAVDTVIEEFGYKRTAFVLSVTLRELDFDGRFSRANKEWGRGTYIPDDTALNRRLTVQSHPAVLDGFISLFRARVQALGLYGQDHCVEGSAREDYAGQVLVMKPDVLKEKYWTPQSQLWCGETGFGCSPTSRGRAVYAVCLGDGEHARWDRSDFAGILKPELLPDWAEERLSELTAEEQQEMGPSMQGPI